MSPRDPPKLRSPLLRYLGAVAVVAAAGLCSDLLYRITHSSRLSSTFLGGVLLAAFLFGSGPGYLAAALSFVVYLWMVDPRYTFAFGSAEDFDTLMVFLAVSLLTGLLIGRMRDEAARGAARARATDTLLDAAQTFSAADDETQIRQALAERLAAAAGGAIFVRDGDRLQLSAPPEESEALAVLSAHIEVQAADWPPGTVSTPSWSFRRLRAGDAVFGVAGWRREKAKAPAPGALARETEGLIDVLIDNAAAAIARIRLSEAKAQAETRARAEDLRNALLSSISHDVRTPLAAILASATSLSEFGDVLDAATRDDLALTIQEEAVRLDAFVANLLHMSRLEAGALKLHCSAFNVPEVLATTLERRKLPGGPEVTLAIEPNLPEALGDAGLFAQALGNVFDNALRYAADAGAIHVAARRHQGRVEVEVRDQGPGVAEADLGRIFEKFFRGTAAPRASGTGLGLSIARGLVEAMGGSVAAANRAPGLSVTLALPVAA